MKSSLAYLRKEINLISSLFEMRKEKPYLEFIGDGKGKAYLASFRDEKKE